MLNRLQAGSLPWQSNPRPPVPSLELIAHLRATFPLVLPNQPANLEWQVGELNGIQKVIQYLEGLIYDSERRVAE